MKEVLVIVLGGDCPGLWLSCHQVKETENIALICLLFHFWWIIVITASEIQFIVDKGSSHL